MDLLPQPYNAAGQAGQKGSNEEGEERLEKMRMMARKAGAWERQDG